MDNNTYKEEIRKIIRNLDAKIDKLKEIKSTLENIEGNINDLEEISKSIEESFNQLKLQ